MREFARNHFCNYISLSIDNETELSKNFLDAMNEQAKAQAFITNLIMTSLDHISKLMKKQENSYESFNKYHKWNKNSKVYQEFENFSEEVIKNYKNTCFKNESNLSIDNSILIEKFKKTLKNSIFNQTVKPYFVFLDDANALLEDSETLNEKKIKITKLKVMRKAIQSFTQIPIAFVIASTNKDLAQFVSNKYTESESEKYSRGINKILYPPFFKTLFIDHLVSDDYFTNLKKSVYENLLNRDPFNDLFKLGRPLWYSTITEKSDIDKYGILDYVCRKIMFQNNWKSEKSNSAAALALFSNRTTLSLDYRVAENSDLVARHLATLYRISDDHTQCAFRYFSEPILAEGE